MSRALLSVFSSYSAHLNHRKFHKDEDSHIVGNMKMCVEGGHLFLYWRIREDKTPNQGRPPRRSRDYSGQNHCNLQKKRFYQLSTMVYSSVYTKVLASCLLWQYQHAGLKKPRQVFGDKKTPQKRRFTASVNDFSNSLAKNCNCHLSS